MDFEEGGKIVCQIKSNQIKSSNNNDNDINTNEEIRNTFKIGDKNEKDM
jgi:hypothetical protein